MGKSKKTTTSMKGAAEKRRKTKKSPPALSVSSPPEETFTESVSHQDINSSSSASSSASSPKTPTRRRGPPKRDTRLTSTCPTSTRLTSTRLTSTRLTSTPVHTSSCLASSPVHTSTRLTSSPVHTSSNVPDSPRDVELQFTERITHLQTSSEVDPSRPRPQNTCRTTTTLRPRQPPKRAKKQQSDAPPVKLRRGRRRKEEQQEETQQQEETTPQRPRPRFELKTPDSTEQVEESVVSSDLSIELSLQEDKLPALSLQEEEEQSDEDEEEEELPSFLMQNDKKPPSITEGVFVWSKYRNYPFWPALVKSVNRKQKKASIIFIDSPVIHQKKGITVSLRSLKPFDCKDYNELVCTAKQNYDAAIEWSLELITDYRIRIACGSFSGSFIEYFAHDMSYPVRRKYPAASERLTIASEESMTSLCEDQEEQEEEQEEHSRSSKRLLPDRSHAAHNRANEKLVNFIVRQRMVERRLLAVIRGQQQSRWLRSFLSSPGTRVVNVYLEDDQQLDQVYWYLNELYGAAVASSSSSSSSSTSSSSGIAHINGMRRVPFVLDVLLPEAIIYAIAGVDNVPVKKAEEKYLKGRSISNRERQEFDLMIEQEIRSQRRNSPRFLCDTNAVAD